MTRMLRWAKAPTMVTVLAVIAGCSGEAPPADVAESAPPAEALSTPAPEQLAFWDRFLPHCGMAYRGQISDVTPYYAPGLEGRDIVMHVVSCTDEALHIAMHLDDNRSRNWIITQVGGTIRLKHDHRNEDGTEEEITQYGGDAPRPGLSHRQIFPADSHTASILPDRADNFWFMDFLDEVTFQYGVHWPRFGHSVRMEFDLSTPIDPPPLPWGY